MEKGIGSLPMSGSQEVDPSLFDNEIARIAKENPSEFGDSLVTGLGEIDPQLVEEFKRDLAQLKPSAALIDALQEMVDEILANPQNYESIRQKYLNQEVPEELLPAFFDVAFFGGLDLALIELEKNVQRPEPPVEMAEGGVPSIAQAIARMGRRGDTMLAHITPEEARLLKRRGGSGTINPRTGLPEFFIKKIFKSAKSILKGVGRAINKIAKSDIGRIALTIAATYYMGPAGFNIGAGTFSGATLTAVQTAAGSTLVNLASGESLKDSWKSGITAGVTAGFGQAIGAALPDEMLGINLGSAATPGYLRTGIGSALAGTGTGLARGQSLEQALKSGVESAARSAGQQYLMDKTVGPKIDKARDFAFREIPDDSFLRKLPFANPSDATPTGPTGVPIDRDPLTDLVRGTGKVFSDTTSNIGSYLDRNIGENRAEKVGDAFTKFGADLGQAGQDIAGGIGSIPGYIAEKGQGFGEDFMTGFRYDPGVGEYVALDKDATLPERLGRGFGNLFQAPIDFYQGLDPSTITDPNIDNEFEGSLAKRAGTGLRKGVRAVGSIPVGLYQGTKEGFEDMYSSFKEAGPTSGDPNFAQRTGDFLEDRYIDAKEFLPTDERRLKLEAKLRAQQEANAITEKAAATKKYERELFAPGNPELNKELYFNRMKAIESAASAPVKPSTMSMYGPAAAVGLGALYAGGAFDPPEEEEGGLLFDPYTFQMFDGAYSPNMYSGLTYRRYNPYLYAQGGDVEKFPRKTGAINGPGTGTSDSIPAMLSDGEFVMTAKAVRSMGNGSRRKGAAKMYKLMRELEKRTA